MSAVRFGRTVMPSGIARLSRDPIHGYPVPYVAEWEDQDMILPPVEHPKFGMTVCLTPHVDGPASLGLMNPERQRECMLESKCQVCAKSIRKGRKFMAGGPTVDWFNEPPTCFECMVFAMKVCPGLVRGRVRHGEATQVLVWEVSSIVFRQMRTGMTPQPVIQAIDAPPDHFSILHFIQARIIAGKSMNANLWLREVGA